MTQQKQDLKLAVEGVDRKLCDRLVAELNQNLANLTHLTMDYKQAHWNVVGPNFSQLHKLFDEFAGETREYSDLCAERAVMLGGNAHGTLHTAAVATQLPRFPDDMRDERELLDHLVAAIHRVDERLSQAIEASESEKRTQDLFIAIARDIEKQRWMLQAHLR